MAAGLGFKDFTTGEVLTAADVDGYLMQGVWVFASAAARDAAVTSPQEGNFAYLKDTNVTTYYTGSAWANLDTTGMTNPMTTTGDIIYSSPGSTPVRLGIGTANQVLRVNSGATAPEWATPSGATVQVASFTEYQASGTAGGTSTSGSFLKRILNTTLTNSITSCTLTSSVISLPAGTYTIVVNSSFVDTDGVQLKLRNTTDSTNTIFGTVGWSLDGNTDPVCTLAGSFTIAGTKDFEIQYRCEVAKAGDGLGRNLNFETNCFTNCVITKVA